MIRFDLISSKVLVDAYVKSAVKASFVWSVESVAEADAEGKLYGVIEGGLSAKHALTPVSGSFTGEKKIALKLKENLLSSGVYYKFKLTVTDVVGTASASTKTLKTNSVPSAGRWNNTRVFTRNKSPKDI